MEETLGKLGFLEGENKSKTLCIAKGSKIEKTMTIREFFQLPEDYKTKLIYEYGSINFYKGEKRQEDLEYGVPNNMHGPDSFDFFLSTKEIDKSYLHPTLKEAEDIVHNYKAI